MSAAGLIGVPPPGAERRIAARGVAWGGVESAVAAGVGLFLTPLVIAKVGVVGLGLWGAAWSLAHSAGLLDLGLGATYSRFAARALARRDLEALNGAVAVGTGLHLSIACVVGGAALAGARPLLRTVAPEAEAIPGAVWVVTLTLATVFLRGAFSVWRGVIAGAQRVDLLGRIGAFAALAEGLVGASVLLAGFGLGGLAAVSCVTAILTTATEARVAHRLCPGLVVRPFRAARVHYRDVLSFGSRLQLTRAFEVLGSHAPRLILAAGPGLSAAGVYDLGARLANVAATGAALPLRVVLPLAGHLEARGDRGRLDALLGRTTGYVALLALGPVIAILLAADLLLVAWTGHPAPAGAATTARLAAAALTLTLIASPFRLALRAVGRVGLEAAATAAATGTLVLLAWPLATRHGAAGVAAAGIGGALAGGVVLFAGATRPRRPDMISPRAAIIAAGRGTLAAILAVAAGLVVLSVFPAPAAATRGAALAQAALLLPATMLVFLVAAILTGVLGMREAALVREAIGREARGGGEAAS